MKRTLLRRGTTPMKRSRIKPVSDTKARWKRQYHAALAARKAAQIAERGHTYCERCDTPTDPDGHHPHGQCGKLILIFRLTCRLCHDLIHSSPAMARAEGWLV